MNRSARRTTANRLLQPSWRLAILTTLILSSVIGVFLRWQSQPNAAETVRQAHKSLRQSRYEEALAKSEEAIRLGADTPSIRLVAGEAALRLQMFQDALRHFERVDDTSGQEGLAARLSAASIMIHQHDVGQAEEQLRRALGIDSNDAKAHRLLSDCLGLQGRRWESISHLQFGIRSGDIDLQSLCYLADTDRTVDLSEEQLAVFLKSDDPKCWLGAACVAISYREFDKAEELIRKCLAANPKLTEAHVRLGKQLLSGNLSSVMKEWNANLPKEAELFPDVWFIRSQWCVEEKAYEQAAACLWRALMIHPDHAAANHQMGHVLSVLGRLDEAGKFIERGRKLTRLATLANEIYMGDSRSAPLKESAELVVSLGRIPEAIGWAVAAQYENPQETWPAVMQQALSQRLSSDMTATLEPQLPARTLDFSEVTWTPPNPKNSFAFESASRQASVAFRDVTHEVGIAFKYENAEDSATAGRLMFEYTGGGVGVLDYDKDGRPDLYFTQAGAQPPFHRQLQATDQLYRNHNGRKFVNETVSAGLRDYRFGQGIAAGDINNDGFPDLYVANIDGNRLYINQGDGTFIDMTADSKIGHPFWTTSVAIADLDGDTIPDLYDVTFLNDKDLFTRVCEEDGVARSCAPAGFAAADDFVYRGVGNGTFADVSDTAGIRVADGDGLGILVADFAASGTPAIFIANDGRANFYFTRDMTAPDELIFSEQALSRGLAFDRDGRAQACMGVASSDFDGDGSWDLFVTNFFNESNTLYLQFAGEIFGDNSQQAGIREPSLSMLGFGTQAIDGDLDGWEDLLIANGHVDDFEYKRIPYRMPMEFYHNTGHANFKRLPAEQLGAAFERPTLGRSMAVIDWNGDGRPEVAVSRLNDPALLLENTSNPSGQFLVVMVVGIQCARDATTTRLTASVNGRQLVRQFTAGDGYQSSNQKQIIFGLGNDDVVETLQVLWPSGHTQTFSDLAAGQTIVLREGDPRAWPLESN